MTDKGTHDMLGNVKGEVYVQLTGASGYEMTGNVKSEIYVVEMASRRLRAASRLAKKRKAGRNIETMRLDLPLLLTSSSSSYFLLLTSSSCF